jgi:hypothetical protein
MGFSKDWMAAIVPTDHLLDKMMNACMPY